MALTKSQTSVKTVLQGIINGLPFDTEMKNKQLTTIDKMVESITVADLDPELKSRITIFNVSAFACMQRCVVPENQFTDNSAKKAEFLATALSDFTALQAA